MSDPVNCPHWSAHEHQRLGRCAIEAFGSNPSRELCEKCIERGRNLVDAAGAKSAASTHRPGPPDCKHWLANGSRRGGVCSIAYYGERPTFAVCAHCMSNGGPKIRGAGDLVSVTIDRVIGAKAHQKVKQIIGGKKGCGCKKRQDQLNDIIPIGSGKK